MDEAAEVVLPCRDLAATLAFFTERLPFRLDRIQPADDPQQAVLSLPGLRLRLQRCATATAAASCRLRVCVRDRALLANGHELVSPDGTRIELVSTDLDSAPLENAPRAAATAIAPPAGSAAVTPGPVSLPPLEFTIAHADSADWRIGRAGMRYRDLIPGRQGGRVIASLIHVVPGGPVPDYVHFHTLRWQLLYCWRGAARLVYEDQGPPFWMHAGDCVLQPPSIRHRVLESSAGLQVVELAGPADHPTTVAHDLQLPTATVDHTRRWHGQQFVHDRGKGSSSAASPVRELGIAAATAGLIAARVQRLGANSGTGHRRTWLPPSMPKAALRFAFVLEGAAELQIDDHAAVRLARGCAVALPAACNAAITAASTDFELFEVDLTMAALTP